MTHGGILSYRNCSVCRQIFPTALNASSRSGKLGICASRRIRSGVFMLSPPIMQPTIILWVFFENRTISFATRIGIRDCGRDRDDKCDVPEVLVRDHDIERAGEAVRTRVPHHVDRVLPAPVGGQHGIQVSNEFC